MSIALDLDNVTVELLVAHKSEGCDEVSLACLEFIRSRLMFDTYSDASKDIDLVSHAIKAHDTRYRGQPSRFFINFSSTSHLDNRDINIHLCLMGGTREKFYPQTCIFRGADLKELTTAPPPPHPHPPGNWPL